MMITIYHPVEDRPTSRAMMTMGRARRRGSIQPGRVSKA